jgi:AAA domain
LTSLWKAGKTTLVSMLLARRKTGAPLAGLAVKPGKTLIVSEEHASLWTDRLNHYDFGGNVCFILRPFPAIPRPEEWRALIERILQLQSQHGIDLLVIDPLAPFLRAENHARSVLEALLPLRELTNREMAVLALHHPGKGERRIGQSARGSGALLGHADIIVEMRHPGGDPHTRRRRFLALSRHQQTPAQMLLELNVDATDYVPAVETDQACDDFPSKWEVLRMVLEDAPQKLTRRDILLEWPEDFDQPDPGTLSRWLNRALVCQSILREGSGHKSDPFRYWLPEKVAQWRADNPCYDIVEEQTIRLKLPFVSLHEKKAQKSFDFDENLE